MKFAHEFKEALLREGFPADWVASAIPYGQLKKCIKKVEGELRLFGLDRTTLKRLDLTNAQRAGRDGSVAFQYRFNADKNFRPKLILFLQPDGLAIDATLSPATRQYLEELASSQEHQLGHVESTDSNESVTSKTCAEEKLQKQSEESHATAIDTERPVIRSIEVPLTFDTEFFGLIQSDVTNIDTLQETEQRSITNEILALSEEIRTLAQPSQFNKKVLRHSKTDLSSWRQLFDIYLQACIFFSNHELDHGSRSSSVAVEKLNWFQSQVMKLGIADSFKLPASHQALDRFVRINVNLLRSLKFQEINKTAITKILKKFDKRTMLGATKTFPKLIQSESLMSENMAKAVCSQISQELVKLVPQVDDYTCPICLSIVWRPVRLGCGHMFCSLCLVKMQEDRDKHCPLCRDDKVMDADEANIDVNLGKFLKKYFPAEVKQKQIELETAAGIRQWGVLYKHPSESQTKCHVM